MDEISLCKKLNFSELGGSRKKGEPKLNWLDDTLQDFKALKMTESMVVEGTRQRELGGCCQEIQGSQRSVPPERKKKNSTNTLV